MADFYSWDKDTLARFAEEVSGKLRQQEAEIAQLRDDLKTMQLAWRNALQREVPTDTL